MNTRQLVVSEPRNPTLDWKSPVRRPRGIASDGSWVGTRGRVIRAILPGVLLALLCGPGGCFVAHGMEDELPIPEELIKELE